MIVSCPNCNLTFPIKDYETSLASFVCARPTKCRIQLLRSRHMKWTLRRITRIIITYIHLQSLVVRQLPLSRTLQSISRRYYTHGSRRSEVQNALQWNYQQGETWNPIETQKIRKPAATGGKNLSISWYTLKRSFIQTHIRSTRQMLCTSEFELQIRWWNGSGVSFGRSSSRSFHSYNFRKYDGRIELEWVIITY